MTTFKFYLPGAFPQKFFRLHKIWPFEVSGVDHGASGRDFLVRKDGPKMNDNDTENLNAWRGNLPSLKLKIADGLEALAGLADDLDKDTLKSPEALQTRVAEVLAKLGLEATEDAVAAPPASVPAVTEPAAPVAPPAAPAVELAAVLAVDPPSADVEPAAAAESAAVAVDTKASAPVEAAGEPAPSVATKASPLSALFGEGSDPTDLLKRLAEAGAQVTLTQPDGTSVTIGKNTTGTPVNGTAPAAAAPAVPAPVAAAATPPEAAATDSVATLAKRLEELQAQTQRQQTSLDRATALLRKQREEPGTPAASQDDGTPVANGNDDDEDINRARRYATRR